MSGVIESLERAQLKRVPDFQSGDRVKVHFQVVEGSRRRTQVFEGTVIKRQGAGVRETFTVRKQSFGVGVERTFPLHSPKIERIEVASRGDVRRAKLYYLRGRVGRRARIREQVYTGEQAEEMFEPIMAADASGTQEEAAPVEAPEGEAEEAPEVPSDAEAKETADEETGGTGPEAEGEAPPSGGGAEEVGEEEGTAEGEETEGAGEPDDAGSQAS